MGFDRTRETCRAAHRSAKQESRLSYRCCFPSVVLRCTHLEDGFVMLDAVLQYHQTLERDEVELWHKRSGGSRLGTPSFNLQSSSNLLHHLDHLLQDIRIIIRNAYRIPGRWLGNFTTISLARNFLNVPKQRGSQATRQKMYQKLRNKFSERVEKLMQVPFVIWGYHLRRCTCNSPNLVLRERSNLVASSR